MAKPRTCIPNNLKRFRELRGYSQKEVAEIFEHSCASRISLWETGAAFPGMLTVFKLSRLYRKDPKDLFDDLYQLAAEEIDALEKKFLIKKSKPHFTN